MTTTTEDVVDYTRWVTRGISYLQLRPPSTPFALHNLPAHIGYTIQSGFALVPGPPLAPYEHWGSAASAFEAFGRDIRLAPAFCGVSEVGRDFFAGRGYRILKLGDEAVVPLDRFTLRGGNWAEVRVALNRAERKDVTVSWLDPAARQVQAPALRSVAEAWQRRKPLCELRFGQGGIDSVFDPNCRLSVASDHQGTPIALASWTPMPPRNGWTLDVMRYRPGVMPGLMDALLATALSTFREEGASAVSLGGVPGSNVGGTPGGWLRSLLDLSAGLLHWPYNPAGLLHFKAKFNPQWEPLYLATIPTAGLVPALTAVVRGVLPAAPWVTGR